MNTRMNISNTWKYVAFILFFSVLEVSDTVADEATNAPIQLAKVKIIVEDGHHHHRHNKGHGSKDYQCLTTSFQTKSCGYGCIKDPYDLTKIYCGEKSGDNCEKDTFGNVKCGKNCIATDMNAITCDKERYSNSSARP
ncbi:Uncharacterised protein [BD1-7 clade bacterium]|uniref:Uncharacterized protein n=1 Tax=BD1-7 clade bacterium TaxID=2029982 RepID=A0A5S9PFM5_9GAMM|nr:Uncharacterised protein [BD1-7 clade bacterium]CAA0102828.1 Uncharacterised protein [BD1-7 clade bacterium]